MNDAEEIISKDNNYSAMTNAICDRCEGYSNEFELQSCKNCYLDTSKPNDINFQVFMKTVDHKVRPFTLLIKRLMKIMRYMHLHFKIFRRKLKDKKNVSTSDDEKNNFRARK